MLSVKIIETVLDVKTSQFIQKYDALFRYKELSFDSLYEDTLLLKIFSLQHILVYYIPYQILNFEDGIDKIYINENKLEDLRFDTFEEFYYWRNAFDLSKLIINLLYLLLNDAKSDIFEWEKDNVLQKSPIYKLGELIEQNIKKYLLDMQSIHVDDDVKSEIIHIFTNIEIVGEDKFSVKTEQIEHFFSTNEIKLLTLNDCVELLPIEGIYNQSYEIYRDKINKKILEILNEYFFFSFIKVVTDISKTPKNDRRYQNSQDNSNEEYKSILRNSLTVAKEWATHIDDRIKDECFQVCSGFENVLLSKDFATYDMYLRYCGFDKKVLWENELNILTNEEMYYNPRFTDFVLTLVYNLQPNKVNENFTYRERTKLTFRDIQEAINDGKQWIKYEYFFHIIISYLNKIDIIDDISADDEENATKIRKLIFYLKNSFLKEVQWKNEKLETVKYKELYRKRGIETFHLFDKPCFLNKVKSIQF